MNAIASSDVAVTVKDLTRIFGSFTAVDHISLSVAKGKVFGFLGPNGAGKSTTIRMLCGLLLPTSGSGTVAGFDVMTESEIDQAQHRLHVAEVLALRRPPGGGEHRLLRRHLPGPEGTPRGAQGLGAADGRARRTRRDHLTGSLAGGWKQRLALGCAVLHEPPILFLDEPTSGVDPISRRQFWDLIAQLSQQGTTVFVTTHYMEEAEYCDELALIYRGRIIAQGTPRAVKTESMPEDILEIRLDRPFEALEKLESSGRRARSGAVRRCVACRRRRTRASAGAAGEATI